jgi:hypothetical protein
VNALRNLCVLALAVAVLGFGAASAEAQGKGKGGGKARGKVKRDSAGKTTARPAKPAEGARRTRVRGNPVGSRPRGKSSEKIFDFTGFELAGSLRMPQLLYFLDRAAQELERASLEKRSFLPELVRSLDEEDL